MNAEFKSPREKLIDLARQYREVQLQSETEKIQQIVDEGRKAYIEYASTAWRYSNTDFLAEVPDCFSVLNWEIKPDLSIPEALGLLKDWTSTLISVETAAIGVIGAVMASDAGLHFTGWQKWSLVATSFMFLLSIILGALSTWE